MKNNLTRTAALTLVALFLSTFGSSLLAAPTPPSPGATAIASVEAPLPVWLNPPPQGNCSLTCTGGTRVLTTTSLSVCCANPGTLCPAGSPPIGGTWKPLFNGSLVDCGFAV